MSEKEKGKVIDLNTRKVIQDEELEEDINTIPILCRRFNAFAFTLPEEDVRAGMTIYVHWGEIDDDTVAYSIFTGKGNSHLCNVRKGSIKNYETVDEIEEAIIDFINEDPKTVAIIENCKIQLDKQGGYYDK